MTTQNIDNLILCHILCTPPPFGISQPTTPHPPKKKTQTNKKQNNKKPNQSKTKQNKDK